MWQFSTFNYKQRKCGKSDTAQSDLNFTFDANPSLKHLQISAEFSKSQNTSCWKKEGQTYVTSSQTTAQVETGNFAGLDDHLPGAAPASISHPWNLH